MYRDSLLFAEDAVQALDGPGAEWKPVGPVGDAATPGLIAWATYAGRRYAADLDAPNRGDALSFRREIAAVAD